MRFEISDEFLSKIERSVPSKQMEICVIKNSIETLSDKAKELWCAERYDFTEERSGVKSACKQITSENIAAAIIAIAHLTRICNISDKEVQKRIAECNEEDASDSDGGDENGFDKLGDISPADILLLAMFAGLCTKGNDTSSTAKSKDTSNKAEKRKFAKNRKEGEDAKPN